MSGIWLYYGNSNSWYGLIDFLGFLDFFSVSPFRRNFPEDQQISTNIWKISNNRIHRNKNSLKMTLGLLIMSTNQHKTRNIRYKCIKLSTIIYHLIPLTNNCISMIVSFSRLNPIQTLELIWLHWLVLEYASSKLLDEIISKEIGSPLSKHGVSLHYLEFRFIFTNTRKKKKRS